MINRLLIDSLTDFSRIPLKIPHPKPNSTSSLYIKPLHSSPQVVTTGIKCCNFHYKDSSNPHLYKPSGPHHSSLPLLTTILRMATIISIALIVPRILKSRNSIYTQS